MIDEEVKEQVYNKYQDIFDFVYHLIETGFDNFKGRPLTNLPETVTLFHHVKATNLIDSISILCVFGYGREALIQVRTLFNLFINIKWLTDEEHESRMTKFAEFEVVNRKSKLDAFNKFGLSPQQPNKITDWIHQSEFDRVKKKYSLERPRDFYNWSGKSIWGMARDLKLEGDYDLVYGPLSELEHTSPASVRGYLDDSEEGVIQLRVGPKDEDIELALLTCLQYYLPVKKIAYSTFDFSLEVLEKNYQELHSLDAKYGNLTKQ